MDEDGGLLAVRAGDTGPGGRTVRGQRDHETVDAVGERPKTLGTRPEWQVRCKVAVGGPESGAREVGGVTVG